MPDVYTRVSKPVGAPYTAVNAPGKEQYDDGGVTYDSSTTFYDGVNPNAYTNISKPVSSTYTIISKPTT